MASVVVSDVAAGDVTRRDHIAQLCEQTGKTPDELGIKNSECSAPDVPSDAEYIWEAFWELSGGRGNNGFSPVPLSWHDIHAWSLLTASPLSPWEAETIRAMDLRWLQEFAKQRSKEKKK